jgi:hypothetical protein
MLTNWALVTVSVVLPETGPPVVVIVALMTELPTVSVEANPAPSMVATLVVAEAQVTWLVRSWVVASEKVPVAVNWRVVPSGLLGLPGVTAIDDSVALVTVRVEVPVSAPRVAVMTDEPTLTLVARPAALIVATPVVAELQVTTAVPGPVLLSE